MSREEYNQRTQLQKANWQVQKATRYNSGSETVRHSICKTLAGHYLHHEQDYSVSFEVVHDQRGEIDVLAWGLDDRISPLAVEVETSPTDDVVKSKLSRYVHGTPIQECFVINVSEMPDAIRPAYDYVTNQL